MKDLDDLELDGDDDDRLDVGDTGEPGATPGPTDFQSLEEGEELPPDLTRERPPIPALVPLLLLVFGVPVALYLLFRPSSEDVAPEGTPAPSTLSAATPAPDPSPEPPPALDLPPLDQSDGAVRELAASLSPHPGLASWLGNAELVRRFVVVVENVADGENPKVHLDFLAPDQGFLAAASSSEPFLDPRSYARYDGIAATVDSVDPEATAALYRNLEPLITAAYQELGHPQGTFDGTLRRAIAKLLAAPRHTGRIDLRRVSVNYAFADPELEALEPAQKQLLRMGPDNQAKLQRKLRQISDALAKPPEAASTSEAPGSTEAGDESP